MMMLNLCLRYCLLVIAATAVVCTGFNPHAFAGKPVPPPTFPPMPIDYLVTWLDAPAGGSNASALGSNSAGTAVGLFTDATGKSRACAWTAGGVFDLNAIPTPVPTGWTLLTARAINEAGQIAGSAEHQDTGQIRIYRYDPPTATAASQIVLMGDPTFSSYQIAYIRPLNNLGDVAYAANVNGTWYGVVQTMDGTLFQRQNVVLNSINDQRQVVGGQTRWNAVSGLVEIFDRTINASDINASGIFVGRIGRNTKRAMRYTTSAQVIGPIESAAYGINSSNDVVGTASFGVGFVFTDTYGYVDLDTLVIAANTDDLASWASAGAIEPWRIADRGPNGFGEIVGTAYLPGDLTRGFLLTPVPVP